MIEKLHFLLCRSCWERTKCSSWISPSIWCQRIGLAPEILTNSSPRFDCLVVVVYINIMKTTFNFNFWFLPSFQPAWIHINMETKRRCQLFILFFLGFGYSFDQVSEHHFGILQYSDTDNSKFFYSDTDNSKFFYSDTDNSKFFY